MGYHVSVLDKNKEGSDSEQMTYNFTFIFRYCGLYFVDYLRDKPEKMVSVNEIIPLLQNAIQKIYHLYYNSEENKKLYEKWSDYYGMLIEDSNFIYDLRRKNIEVEDEKYEFFKYTIQICIDYYENILKLCYINYDGFVELGSY